jgi:hypothetical protein
MKPTEPAPGQSAAGNSDSFAVRFCRHFAIGAARYPEEMLRRSLHRHARLVKPFMSTAAFSADRDFVSCVGQMTRRQDFSGEAVAFHDDPTNRHFWRRYGRVRVSLTRVRRLLNVVWP